MRGSSRAAALAIVPLAAVQLASSAKAQAVFALPGNANSVFASGNSYNAPGSPTGYFQATLPTVSGIAGALVGASFSVTINNSSGSGGYYSSTLKFSVSGGTAFPAATIPVTYSFTLGETGGTDVATWNLKLFTSDNITTLVSGSGLGLKTGTVNYTIGSTTTDGSYSLELFTDFSSAQAPRTFSITMDQGAGQGIALNATAIPEPSTYATWFGAGAVLFAFWRRSLRRIVG